MEIHELAGVAYEAMETAARDDESSFVRVKKDAPEWVSDLVREAHGADLLPDDWRYKTIREALNLIHEAGAAADESETGDEFADNVDVYTSDRLAWLGSHLSRPGYCDEAEEELGPSTDEGIMGRIGLGQYMERREVFGLVWSALEDRAEDDE